MPKGPLAASDEADLPLTMPKAARGLMDLPAARTSPPKAFGEIDLEVDLPAPTGSVAPAPYSRALEAEDLPVVTAGPPAFLAPGLPAPRQASPVGEAADLPLVHAALPMAGGAGLPAPAAFGEIDLPRPRMPSATFGEVDLPRPPSMSAMFGEIDLPGLTPGLPVAQASGLPAPAAGFPVAQASGLPLPAAGFPVAQASGLPAPAAVAAFAPGGSVRPPPPPRRDASAFDVDLPPPPAPSSDDAQEFSFDEVPSAPPGGMDAHAGGMDIGTLAPGPEGDVGAEVELGAGPISAAGARSSAQPGKKEAPPEALVELAPKRSAARRYVIAAVVLATLGGGALALVPGVGAFGAQAISDRFHATSNEQTLVALRQSVEGALDVDTAPEATRAVSEARATHEAAPRFRPTSAFAAYAVYARSLRFGRRGDDEAYARQLLAELESEPTTEGLALAQAAEQAAAGQIARARQALAPLAPSHADAAVLAAEVELLAKDDAKAVAAWKHASSLRKSARTLFGLARAELAAGNAAEAEAQARAALAASPKHVGARSLIASIEIFDSARQDDALALLSAITENAEQRAQASDPELVTAYTLLGHLHLSHSRASAAEQAFGAALKLDPQSLQALIGNGELFYLAGRYSEALARFEAAVRADADSVVAKVGAAKTWMMMERLKEAKDLLKKLSEAKPKDPLVAYWLGRAEEAIGNKKDAEASYASAIRVGGSRPEVVDASVALARVLSAEGRDDEAAQRLVEAIERFPDSAELDRARGDVALKSGRYVEAKANFEQALQKQDNLGTKFLLGTTLRRMGDFAGAEKLLDQIGAADKDFPGLALERGLLFEQTGQSERALEMYAAALKKAPNDLDLKLRVGSTQVIAGHAKLAEPVLREVWKERPNSAEANHFLGRALLVSGVNLTEAIGSLSRAAELDPHHAEYWLYVGWAANELGQPGRAEAALKKAIDLDKNLGDAYWQRGVLLQAQGQTIDALADLKMALEKSPSRFEAYATMALCYQDQSNWTAAEDAWRKAIAGNDKIADWHYRLGKIANNRANRGEAIVEIGRAIALGEAPGVAAPPAWLFDAHFLLGEALRATDRAQAIAHYRRFLATAPRDNAYRSDAEKALAALGAERVR
jgi:tetratricopeptide (TPR) repeat protein